MPPHANVFVTSYWPSVLCVAWSEKTTCASICICPRPASMNRAKELPLSYRVTLTEARKVDGAAVGALMSAKRFGSFFLIVSTIKREIRSLSVADSVTPLPAWTARARFENVVRLEPSFKGATGLIPPGLLAHPLTSPATHTAATSSHRRRIIMTPSGHGQFDGHCIDAFWATGHQKHGERSEAVSQKRHRQATRGTPPGVPRVDTGQGRTRTRWRAVTVLSP